jgi:hypothetical protein
MQEAGDEAKNVQPTSGASRECFTRRAGFRVRELAAGRNPRDVLSTMTVIPAPVLTLSR